MRKNVRFTLPGVATMAMLAILLAFDASRALGQTGVSVVGDPRHPSHGPYAELAKVPEKARAKPNPLQYDPDAVAAGGKLYEQHCAECHGAKAGGTKRGPSLMQELVEQATPGALFWILSNGVVRHGMPDWSKLPEQQRWQLVSFIKSFRAAPAKPETLTTPGASKPCATKDSSLPRR
jgi:mono/diheme cytochrome c family protein